jgi:hypothetical protein
MQHWGGAGTVSQGCTHSTHHVHDDDAAALVESSGSIPEDDRTLIIPPAVHDQLQSITDGSTM